MKVFIVRTGKDLHKAKATLKNEKFDPNLILVSNKLQHADQAKAELEKHYPEAQIEKSDIMSWGPRAEPLPVEEIKLADDVTGDT